MPRANSWADNQRPQTSTDGTDPHGGTSADGRDSHRGDNLVCARGSRQVSAVYPEPNIGLWGTKQISAAGGSDQGMATGVKARDSALWCGNSWLIGNWRSGMQKFDCVIVEGSYFMVDGIILEGTFIKDAEKRTLQRKVFAFRRGECRVVVSFVRANISFQGSN